MTRKARSDYNRRWINDDSDIAGSPDSPTASINLAASTSANLAASTTISGLGCADGDMDYVEAPSPDAAPAIGDPPMASFASIPTLADYLITGFWGWSGYGGTGARHWADPTDISVNVQDLTAAEQAIAIQALNLWDDVCNVHFTFTTGAADITYINDGSGSAVTSYGVSGTSMSNATVHISSDWSGGAGTGNYSYFFQTYVHETGHALGLGHQGPYNGSGTYGVDNIFTNDTWRWSVMSYFSENNYSSDTYDYVLTPQMADIYAVISIYGAQSTRTGNTTYGFNSTAGSFYDFATYSGTPAFTLYDTGGTDTLDASGYFSDQTIDLTPGNWSSIGGEVDNIGIYLNTTIENAKGGSGDDTIFGNDANNSLYGGAGDDTLKGAGGADFLSGDADNDSLNGGDGNDTLYGGNGNDSMKGVGGADFLYGGAGIDTATYDQATVGVDANLSTGVGQFGDAAGDTYLDVENVFGSTGNDTLTGNSVANALTGDDGNDTIDGFLGDDTLSAGNGTDTLSYALDRGVTVSLAVIGAQATGGSGTDTVSGFENLTGSYFNDTLTGDANNNVINGNGGADILNGGAGDDTITAGSPNTFIVKPQAQHNLSMATAVNLDSSFVQTSSSIVQDSTATPHATILATASGDFEYYSFTVTAGASAVFDIDQTAGVDTYLRLFSTDGTTQLASNDDATVDAGSATGLDSYLSYTFAAAGTYFLRVDRYPGSSGPVAGSTYTLNVSLGGATLANPTAGSTINAGAGTDTAIGSYGNDRFIDDDFVNFDVYSAGSGIDTIDYSAVTFANGVVTVDLIRGQTIVTGGNTETISGFENVEGSQGGELLILGTSFNNVLDGNNGSDTIDGFLGNDTMDGGGSGGDILSYGLDRAVTVSLGVAGPQNTIGAGIDTQTGFENLTGSFFNDSLTGNAGNNVIRGGGGTDNLYGAAGNDTLIAGATNAHIVKLEAQSNATVATAVSLDGHFGLQSADFIANSTTIPHATVMATASGNFEYYSFSVAAGQTAIFDIDQTTGVDTWLELFSTDGTTLLATQDDSTIDAGSGTTLDSSLSYTFASGGTYFLRVDRFAGGIAPIAGSLYTLSISIAGAIAAAVAGGSRLNGGDGDDLYQVYNAGDKVIELAGEGTDTVQSALTWALSSNVENLTLTGFGNVDGTGNTLDNVLTGNFGNNVLSGGDGNDTLIGGDGNDTLIGGPGNDLLNGGNGSDTASYVGAAGAVTVALVAGAQNTGGADTDTLTNIENITGSSYNDDLTGNSGDNVLVGGAGDDTLNGRAGNDTLDGGSGLDTASYAGTLGAVTVALVPGAQNTIHAGIDTLISIENLTGSSFNDSLTGNTGANILSGADGNDTLSGGTGSDTLDGGAGTDTASFAGNAVFVTVALVAGPQNTGAGSDTLIGIENLTGSSFADSLTGDANANLLRGGDGNDTLNGRAGDDTLDGGNGIDTADYTGAAAGVTVAVVAGAQNTGGSGIDTLVGIENLTGSGNNDTLTGNGSNNVLSGNSGADSLFGLDGSDTLLGGIGGDLLVGGLGRDFLTGGSSGDIFDFNAVSETGTSSVTRDQILDFVQGSDHIDLSTIDANTLVGGDQAFAFIGAAAFSGVAGQLRSAAGANTIVMGDINGDSVADFQIQLNGNFVLTAANFVA